MAIHCNKYNLINIILQTAVRRSVHKLSPKYDYEKCYNVLELENNAEQEKVRVAFLNLAKKYHPDSKSDDSDVEKFNEIESAYRMLQEKFSIERHSQEEGLGEFGLYYNQSVHNTEYNQEEVKEFDIKHTAPQHRQYLSYGGYGIGTTQQRERQYQKYRVITAAENVLNHRISKHNSESNEDALVIKDKKQTKRNAVRYGMDRLVEDLIQQSMAKGEFDNLSCKGKPLPDRGTNNPYVDFVTHKINQVLIDNGFAPEWITLQKEINKEIEDLRKKLFEDRQCLGENPLSAHELSIWNEMLEKYNKRVQDINSKINKFNLLVPLMKKQMFLFQLHKEASKALNEGQNKLQVKKTEEVTKKMEMKENTDFIAVLYNIFSKETK